MIDSRSTLAATRLRLRRLADRRQPRVALSTACARHASAPPALDPGHDDRPRRRWASSCWAPSAPRLEHRADANDEARRPHRLRRLRREARADGRRCRGPTTSPSARRSRQRRRQALHRAGSPSAACSPCSAARWPRRRSRPTCCATSTPPWARASRSSGWVIRLYLQSAGAVDLAGRRALRAGRLRLAVGPAAAHRRAVAETRPSAPPLQPAE